MFSPLRFILRFYFIIDIIITIAVYRISDLLFSVAVTLE